MEGLDYSSLAGVTAGGLMGFSVGLILMLIIPIIAIVVFEIIGQWKIFQKAGKGGWEAIVPIYNSWVLVEISGLNWWWFLILIIGGLIPTIGPLVTIFAAFQCNYNISKKYGKDVGTAILMTLFPFVMYPLMGFSKEYTFDNNTEVSPNGVF